MSLNSLKTEIVLLLRNSDVFSTAQRGVTTTTTDEIPISEATEYTLNVANVKNIRELKIGASELTYGKDYTINLDHIDTTRKCKITFNSAQTGDLVIKYDAGTDKIWTDLPRDDLTIDSYPRIAVEEISKSTEPLSLGGTDFISSRMITIIVYTEHQDDLETTLNTIEELIKTNAKSLYYANYIHPSGRGPLIKHPIRNQTILQKNIDCLARWEVN